MPNFTVEYRLNDLSFMQSLPNLLSNNFDVTSTHDESIKTSNMPSFYGFSKNNFHRKWRAKELFQHHY